MFEKKSQKRDLRYGFYVALIVFIWALQYWWSTTELLSFWLGLAVSVPAFLVTYIALRVARLVGGLTGLAEPYNRAKGRIRDRFDEIVEEIDEEIEKERQRG